MVASGQARAPDALTAPRAQPRRASRALLVAGLVVAALSAIPAVYLLIRSSDAGAAGIVEILTDAETLALFARTAALAVAVTAASVAIGVPLAWLTTRTDMPWRRTLGVLTAAPLVIPSYVGGYVVVAALGPRGILQGWLEPLGVQRLPEIYGFFGAWLTLTLFTYPYVLITARAAMRRMDPSLEEAALSLGRSPRQVFRSVTLPQLRPSIAAGGLLVGLYVIHDFGAVSLLRYDSFTRQIFLSYSASFDRSRAAVLSLALVALTIVVVLAEVRSRGRAVYHPLYAGGGRAPRTAQLGRWRWPATLACAAVVVVALAIPVGVIVYWLARSVSGSGALWPTVAAAGRSLALGAIAGALALVAAWPVAMLAARSRSRASRAIETVSYTGFALPGIVVALSLVFFGVRVVPWIYQTVVLLLFAYLVLFLPQAIGALRASMLQVSPSIEEAGRSLGAGPMRRTTRLLVPLVGPGLMSGGALVFLTVIKELPATLLLAPAGFRTLATEVWSATSASLFDQAAAPALALIVLALIPMALLRERS